MTSVTPLTTEGEAPTATVGEARSVPSALILDYRGHVGVGLITDGRPSTGSTGIADAIGPIPDLGGSGMVG